MLKEITRAEAVEKLAKEKPVFALFEIDGDMTINDLLTADSFVIDVPAVENKQFSDQIKDMAAEAAKPVEEAKSDNFAKVWKDIKESAPEQKEEAPKETPKRRHTDQEFRDLHAQGLTNKEIAKKLGCSEFTVASRLTKIGLERNR